MLGYGDRRRTQIEVVQLFNEVHPNLHPISQSAFSKIVKQYRQLGHVRPVKRHPTFVEDVKLNILLSVEETPTSSTRDLATASDVSHSTVLRCLKKVKLHPFKIHYVQDLRDDDSDRRLECCEQIMNQTS